MRSHKLPRINGIPGDYDLKVFSPKQKWVEKYKWVRLTSAFGALVKKNLKKKF